MSKFILTPHQQEKGDAVIDALTTGQKRIILQGAAGVGKTTLVSALMDYLEERHIGKRYDNGLIYITAPTNKALAVLQSKIESENRPIKFKTVHAALGLKRNINDKTGDVAFVPGWMKPEEKADFKNCKVCFIDEASMLNTQLLEMLDDYHFPIIFVGDRFQINPVGEKETPVFNRNYPVFELTEIVRQGEGNPIITLSRDLDMLYFKMEQVTEEGKGYVYENSEDTIIRKLAEVNGTDEMKYLAWSNNQVDKINNLVRIKRYGQPAKIELGETVVFNAPYGNFYTNQEVMVKDLQVITDNRLVPTSKTKFFPDGSVGGIMDRIKMKYYRVNEKFDIVHEDYMPAFRKISAEIKNNCKKYGWSWKTHFFFVEQFADIKYNHALTIHKSQGSTYKTAVINIADVDFNKDAREKQRLLYTAVTRASDLVILNNVR